MLRSAIRKLWQHDKVRRLLAGPAVKRLRTAVAVALAAALANGLLYAGAVAPAADSLNADQGQLSELRRQHADALLFQKQKQALAGLNKGALTQKDVPLLIKDLVQMARRQSLAVDTISSDIPTPTSGGLTVLSFTVPLTGSYPNLKRFIYELETSDRLLGIQGLRLSSDQKGIKLDLKLITYIRGE